MPTETGRAERFSDEDVPGRKIVERFIRETIRRVIEASVGKITEGPENLRSFVSDIKLPKEIANYIFLQIDETKNGLYRVVAKEIRGFLQQNDLGDELARALSHLSVDINTQIRFVPTSSEPAANAGLGQPEVRASVRVKSDRPPPDSSRTGQS